MELTQMLYCVFAGEDNPAYIAAFAYEANAARFIEQQKKYFPNIKFAIIEYVPSRRLV